MVDLSQAQIFKRPPEFISWFNQVLKAINDDPSNKKNALTHAGPFKKFYEEIFPLATLLKIKGQEWKDSEFRNVFGSQSYDVEVRNHSLRYFEIVCADFDDGERFRMLTLLERKSVDALGKITRDADGRADGIEQEGSMRLHTEVVEEKLVLIESRIRRKLANSYPEKTALIVYFDETTIELTPNDYAKFSRCLRNLRPEWRRVFVAVYIFGPSAKHCIEDSAI